MKKDIKSRFGNRVRQEREHLGLSQEGLASRCGLHRTYIGGIERGERNPTLQTISLLADALDVAIVTLLDFRGEK
jgi:transcriptional regulator with XRE-family HTH domain